MYLKQHERDFMTSDRPALSKSELEIARILWALKNATVREVFEEASELREIDFATVQTYLRRLEKKGYAKAKLDGRVRVYSPRVKPQTVIRETIGDLVDRLFGGEAMPLMQHLIEERDLSDDDIAKLRELLDKAEE